MLVRQPGRIWLAAVAIMMPLAVITLLIYNDVTYDPLSGLPQRAPSVAGSHVLERHFPKGVLGLITILLQNNQVDFASSRGIELIGALTANLAKQKDSLAIADLRSVAKPLGITEAAQEAIAKLPLLGSWFPGVMRQHAIAHYVSHVGDLKGHVTRLELVLAEEPLSPKGIEDLDRVRARVCKPPFPRGYTRGPRFLSAARLPRSAICEL